MGRSGGNAIVHFGILLFFFYSLGYGTVEGTVRIKGRFKKRTIVEKIGSLDLQCDAVCTNGTCEYQWSSRDFALKDTTTQRSMTISHMSRKISDYEFICVVTDKGDGHTDRCARRVEVYYSPEVNVTEDDDGVKCEAKGNPNNITFVSWQHTVKHVPVRTWKPGEPHLTLNSSYENRGKYECVVSNGIESYKNQQINQKSSTSISRDVKPIVLTSKNVTQRVSKGNSFSTTMKVYSYPLKLKVNIFKDEEENTSRRTDLSYVKVSDYVHDVGVTFYNKHIYVSGTIIYLRIYRMKEDYFGRYTIELQNSVGKTSVSAQIIPQGPPDAPVYFEVSHISHKSVIFYLTSGFYNGASQTLQIQYRTYNGSTWMNGTTADVGSQQNKTVRMEVTGLKPETTYTFRAYCFNIFDSSEAVKLVVVTAKEPTDWLVVGLTVGASVIFVILVIVFILLRIKFRGKKKIPRMLPKVEVNDIFARDNDVTDASPEDYENAHLQGAHIEIYENTTAKLSSSQGFSNRKQENNYANVTQLVASTFQPAFGRKEATISDDTAIYSNTNGMTDTNKACNNTTTTEKHYANVQPVEVEEDDYLDMEVNQSKPRLHSLQSTNVKYTSKKSSVSTSFRDNNSKKNKVAETLKKLQESHGMPTEPSEIYMDMEAGNRESMPNYVAPPPPTQHKAQFGDDYVNLRKKGKNPL